MASSIVSESTWKLLQQYAEQDIKSKQGYKILMLNKIPLKFEKKDISRSLSRRCRVLVKMGYMQELEYGRYLLYTVTPEGAAKADQFKMQQSSLDR